MLVGSKYQTIRGRFQMLQVLLRTISVAEEAKPEDKDQYNFTDPESRIMKGADGIVQGYNAQAAVEPELLLIVGQSVTEAAHHKQPTINSN